MLVDHARPLPYRHFARAVAYWHQLTDADVGVRRRLFEGATRRAIEVRDRECFHPLCEEPVDRCQADHVLPYADGGSTVQDNGRLACGPHNRLRDRRPQGP
jgi:hypothetical protein